MLRLVIAVVVALVATLVVASLILGHYPDEGPYVTVSPSHGIHVGDVVLLVLWGSLLWGLRRWTRRRRPAGRS